jgi:hypothetical protein
MVIKKQLPKNGGKFHSITGQEDGK